MASGSKSNLEPLKREEKLCCCCGGPFRLFVRDVPVVLSVARLSIPLPHPSSFRVSTELAREKFRVDESEGALPRRGFRFL